MRMRSVAVAGLLGLALAACGEAPDQGTPSPGATATGTTDFQGCMVTDQGGIDDRSFNASAWAGLQAAAEAGGFSGRFVTSRTEADYTPNVNSLMDAGCGIIVTVGFGLADATRTAALANPDERFAIVDANPDADPSTADVNEPIENVRPLLYDTAQAAYLAGYLAAGMTQSGSVGTFGGQNTPPVTVFMDGFSDGIDKYNEEHDTSVKLIGWSKAQQNGTFAGRFDSPTDGKRIATNLSQQGADIIMPVAGQTGLGATAYAHDSDGKVAIIWADTDGYISVPQNKDVFLTTVEKNVVGAVEIAATDTFNGLFSNTPYIGTLANEGVGLAPFHAFEDRVPAELAARVAELQQQIIDGVITVESASSPTLS